MHQGPTPVKLVGTSAEMTKSEALKLEHRIKKMPASRKQVERYMATIHP